MLRRGNRVLARRYARALLEVAKESAREDVVFKDMQRVKAIVESVPFIRAFLRNPVIPPERKIDLVKKVLGKYLDHLTTDFLILLIRRGRVVAVDLMAREYELLYYEDKGMLEIQVDIPVEPSSSLKEYLIRWCEGQFNKQPVLKVNVKPELIGGVRITAMDKTIDVTVRKQLQNFMNRFRILSKYTRQV